MAEHLNDLEQLAKEVSEYRSRFQESSEVLDDLAKVQIEFEGLTQKYQELKQEYQELREYIEEARTVSDSLQAESKSTITQVIQAQESFDQRFADLERATTEKTAQAQGTLNQQFAEFEQAADSRLQEHIEEARTILASLQAESNNTIDQVVQAQESFDQRFVDLKQAADSKWEQFRQQVFRGLGEFEQQNQELKKEFEERLAAGLEDLESRQRVVQGHLNSLESSVETTRSLINQVQEDTAQRLESLEGRIGKTLDQRLRETRRNSYIFAGTGFLLAVVLATALSSLLQSGNEARYRQAEPPVSQPGKSTY